MAPKEFPSQSTAVQHRTHDDPAIRNLAINFFPITLSSTNVRVWVAAWKDTAAADAICASKAGLVTWRDPDDGSRMYVWHATETLHNLAGFKEVTVAFDESPRLFQRLVQDAAERRLGELGFIRKGFGFVNFSKPSLLAKVPALAAASAEPIGIYPKIVLEVFFTKDAKGSVVLGLVVDVLYSTRLDVTAAEWAAAGFTANLPGKYVVLIAPSEASERFPQLVGKAIGCIDRVRGDRAILRDPREPALVDVPLSAVAPEPNRWNLHEYLALRHQNGFAAGEAALTQKVRDLVRPGTRQQLADIFVRDRFDPRSTGESHGDGLVILPDATARVGEMVRANAHTFPAQRLVDPVYSFDRAGNKFEKRVDLGLQNHGPYDSHQMRGKRFRLLVLAPAEHQGQVQAAVQRLLAGVSTPQNVFTGMRTMYRLDALEVKYAFAKTGDTAPMTRYAEALTGALQNDRASGGECPFNLVLAVIRQEHRDLPDSENPYFQTKAQALILGGVPTQAVTIEKLRQPDSSLQYVLNTMAVACYGKIGGTSHVLRLPDDPDATTEMVFGIGRSIHRTTRFGQGAETIGFATVFRANGEYLYNDCTPYCSDSNYERAFEETIRRTVERVAQFEHLEDGASLRLVFHVPRRAGRREERAILNAVGKLPRFSITFALVHVNDDHPFQVFDLSNRNPTSWGKPKPNAALLPRRGLSLAVGPRERLVTFVGVDQYKGYGLPAPLRLTLDRRSTFTDIDYLSQQIYWLSFMNVGSLTPGTAPVTIAYAEKLAELTGKLRGVAQWTVELIQQRLGRKLWFV